jgi:hypothetical protein
MTGDPTAIDDCPRRRGMPLDTPRDVLHCKYTNPAKPMPRPATFASLPARSAGVVRPSSLGFFAQPGPPAIVPIGRDGSPLRAVGPTSRRPSGPKLQAQRAALPAITSATPKMCQYAGLTPSLGI